MINLVIVFAGILCIYVPFVADGLPNGNQSVQFDDDEVGWTNINEQLDISLELIWPLFIEMGYTKLSLPDITETISVRPLFITYSAQLWLTNGLLSNIKDIKRHGDAMMTYHNKSFQFRAYLVIGSVEFTYDFALKAIGLNFIGGNIVGLVKNTQLLGEFSITADQARIELNDFRIVSFGDVGVQLKKHSIISWLSETILRQIVRLFNDRLTTSISEGIKGQLEQLISDINANDQLQLQEFVRGFTMRILGQQMN